MLMLATATAYRLWDKAQAGAQSAVTASAKTIKTVTHRIVNRQTGEILPDSRSLLRQAGHLAAPPLSPRRHKPLAPDAPESGSLNPPLAHHLLDGQGLQRWRQQLRHQNRDKLIVFIADHYAIFDTHEFLVLTHVPVSHTPSHLGSRADILRRYGCLPQPP